MIKEKSASDPRVDIIIEELRRQIKNTVSFVA
jgi:hypothetical protein